MQRHVSAVPLSSVRRTRHINYIYPEAHHSFFKAAFLGWLFLYLCEHGSEGLV